MEFMLLIFVFLVFLTPLLVAYVFRSILASDSAKGMPMSILNVFSAGLFMSIAFFHSLAESYPQTEKLFPNDDRVTQLRYMFASFLAGWLLMLWVEKVIIGALGKTFSIGTPQRPGGDTMFTFSRQNRQAEEAKEASSLYLGVLATMFGLSLHSFFVGTAIGLELEEGSYQMWALMILFPIHKSMDAVVFSTQLSKLGLSKGTFLFLLLLFSSMTPTGIFATSSLLAKGSILLVYAGVLEAASGGIFMYVATMHLLSEELDRNKGRRAIFLVAVFTASVVLSFFSTRVLEFFESSGPSSVVEDVA